MNTELTYPVRNTWQTTITPEQTIAAYLEDLAQRANWVRWNSNPDGAGAHELHKIETELIELAAALKA